MNCLSTCLAIIGILSTIKTRLQNPGPQRAEHGADYLDPQLLATTPHLSTPPASI